jgi:peptide/nickel transport system substrate-binding protein
MVSDRDRVRSRPVSRRTVLSAAAVAGSGIAAAALIGCGSSDDDASEEASGGPAAGASSSEPRIGGVARISNSIEPTIWDPVISEAAPPATYAAPLYPHLFVTKITPETKGNEFEFEPDLVQSWEQPDPLTYVFKLHPNGKWGPHSTLNNRAITAKDVVYSLERWRSAESVIRGNFTPVDTVQAVDDTTVKVQLKHAFSPFIAYLSDTSAAVTPPEVGKALTELGTAQQVRGGPWLLDSYEPGVKVGFKRNSEFYLGPVPYADIDIYIYPEAATAATAFESRQILTRAVSVKERDRLIGEHPELKTGSTGAAHQSIYFNTEKKPWNDPRVRKALRLAIDFNAYRKARFPDGVSVLETPARAWLAPYALPQADLETLYKVNVEEAKRLLAAAGFANGFDGGDLYAYPLGNDSVDLIQPIVTRLKETLNVSFQIKQVEYSVHQKMFKSGDFAVGLFIYSRRYPDTDQYLYPRLHSTGALNYSRGKDAKLDELLDRQRRETDVQTRVATVREIQRSFIEDLNWMIVVPTNEANAVWWPELAGYNEHVSFGQYQLRKAWLNK